MRLLLWLLAMPTLILPAGMLGYLFSRAVAGFGEIHSLIGQVMGSLLLAVLGCSLSALVALGLALWLRLCSPPVRQRWLLLLQLLQGVPPIVYGLCGLVLFVQLLHWGVSLLGGALVLSAVVLPQLSLNFQADLQRVPAEMTDAARALGLNNGAVMVRVWLPYAWPGLLTGLLLGLARALAETAPILFTAAVFSGVIWPESLLSPVTTLQTHIFYLAQEGNDKKAIDTAWTAAGLLVVMVLFCSQTAVWLRNRRSR